MNQIGSQSEIQMFDNRRNIVIPGNHDQTLLFCIDHFIHIANESIKKQGYFAVALSGGSTPKAIYQGLASPKNQGKIDWTKVLLFWGDERSVPPDSAESNYKMAMDAAFSSLPLLPENIFRMEAESDIEKHAKDYEELIRTKLPNGTFDLVMLGMGEDGHTASLFPKTHGLTAENRLVIANFVSKLNTWRMSFTYECINQSRHIAIYVLGKGKAAILKEVLTSDSDFTELPIQKIGTPQHQALWIIDNDAAELLNNLTQ